jgi:peptidase M23-like protein
MYRSYWLVLLTWFGNGSRATAGEIPSLKWPTVLRDAKISQRFGVRAQQPGKNFGSDVRHAGLDLGVPKGSPVYAADDGIVRWAEPRYLSVSDAPRFPGARKAIVIEHTAPDGSKFTTSYGHVDYSVKAETTVRRGVQIGTVADWGSNTHLHFGIRRGAYDPRNPNPAIYGRVSAGELGNYVDPFEHFQKHAIEDLSRDFAKVFGGTQRPGADRGSVIPAEPKRRIVDPVHVRPDRRDRAVRDPLRRIIPNARTAEESAPDFTSVEQVSDGTAASIGGVDVTLRSGWAAARTVEGGQMFGPGGNHSWDRFVNVFRHPGFPNAAYTPQGINATILRFSRVGAPSASSAVRVGKEQRTGVWARTVKDGVVSEHVLVTIGGSVYMISTTYRVGDTETSDAFRTAARTLRAR